MAPPACRPSARSGNGPACDFGQVYAARERLMVGIGHACRGRGVGRVQVVMHPFSQGDQHIVAIAQQAR